MSFQNIIGQQKVKEQLINLVQQNRLSHALLFLSKEGSGALQLALAFAQYIVCEKVNGKSQTQANSLFGEETITNEKQETLNDSCGSCPACKKAQALIHPDIHFSYPVITKKSGEKPKSTDFITEWREFVKINPYGNSYDWLQFIEAENKQGNITAEECNDIIKKLSLKSFESEYKVLIMWLPEYLGNEGNKLLKLIEEPPAKTLFILVAENEQKILPTIISRTQLVKINALTNTEVEQALIERANVEQSQANSLAAMAQGNYRQALQLLQQNNTDAQTMLREWLNAIVKFNPVAQLKWIEETAKMGRENQKQFLQYFIHLLELAVRQQAINRPIISNTETDFAHRLNKITQPHQQQAMVTELNHAIYYIERNANAKMLFHALTIKLYHIISNNSLILVN